MGRRAATNTLLLESKVVSEEHLLPAAIRRAGAVADLAGRLRTERGLDTDAAFLAAHLVIAHGWGEDAAVSLPESDRIAYHDRLAHDGGHHH